MPAAFSSRLPGRVTVRQIISDGEGGLRLATDNLRRLRAAKRWSQERLGDEAGLHRTCIGSVEGRERNISLDNLALLAWALGVPVAELVASPRQGRRTASARR